MQVPLGDTYYFKFTTRSFSTGAPTQLAGTPVISVYEEANLTQITAGVTLTVDYDTVTGLNDVAIVATTANGYEAGKYYDVVITTGTVGGVSVVGEVVGHFRIMPAEDAGAGIPDVNVTHWLDTAAATPTTAGVPEVDVTYVSGTAQTANDNGADLNTLLTRIVGTLAAGTHNAQSGDIFAQLPTNFADLAIAVTTGLVSVGTNNDKTGYSLTATTGLGNQTADITGSLSGSVGSVTGAVGSVTGNVGGNVTGSVGSLGTTAKSDVNAEVVDALATDTYAEPGQGAPAATTSLAAKINYLYKAWRNKSTQTATEYALYDDAGTTVDQKATVSDDATTATKGEVGTGP